MNLVIIPFHDWKKCEREGFRTRDAHFMQEFDKHPLIDKMLVINRPISWSEIILKRRNVKPLLGTVLLQKNGVIISQVTAKTYTLDIVIKEIIQPIRLRRHWTSYIFGQEVVEEAVKMALEYLEIAAYAMLIASPIFVPLIKNLNPPILAFDALDNFLQHSLYRNVPGLEGYYQYCLDKADFISANSQATTDWFKQTRADAVHIPNGVDDKKFDGHKKYSVPTDMVSIASPIIGYAGKMQEMFDVLLMSQVVKRMPDLNFVFIGQQLDPDWMKPLWKFANVHYLGDKPYKDLPNYLAAFDVCIIPYNVARQHGGDPIKFYEYLAMGKPVVTTDIGNVHAFSSYPQVHVAHSADSFIDGLNDFVGQIKSGNPILKQSIPTIHFWSTKADYIVRRLVAVSS